MPNRLNCETRRSKKYTKFELLFSMWLKFIEINISIHCWVPWKGHVFCHAKNDLRNQGYQVDLGTRATKITRRHVTLELKKTM